MCTHVFIPTHPFIDIHTYSAVVHVRCRIDRMPREMHLMIMYVHDDEMYFYLRMDMKR